MTDEQLLRLSRETATYMFAGPDPKDIDDVISDLLRLRNAVRTVIAGTTGCNKATQSYLSEFMKE